MVILNHPMKPIEEKTQKIIETLQVNSPDKFSFKVIHNMFRLCFRWKILQIHHWKQMISSLNVSNNLGFDPLGFYISKLYRSLYSLKKDLPICDIEIRRKDANKTTFFIFSLLKENASQWLNASGQHRI